MNPQLLSLKLLLFIQYLIVQLLYVLKSLRAMLVVGSSDGIVKQGREGIDIGIVMESTDVASRIVSPASIRSSSTTGGASITEVRGASLGMLLHSLDLNVNSFASVETSITEELKLLFQVVNAVALFMPY